MPAKKTKTINGSNKIVVNDVKKPEDSLQSTGSRPTIVTNKPLVEDPMIAKKASDDSPEIVARNNKLINPDMPDPHDDKEVKEIDEVEETEDVVEEVEEPKKQAKKTKSKAKKVEPEEPEEESSKNEEEPVEASEVPEVPGEEERSDEEIGGWTKKIDEIASEEESEESTETQGDAKGGKWQEFAPHEIHAVEADKKKDRHRSSTGHKIAWIFTGLILGLVVILVVLNLLIDLEMVDVGIKPITNFF
ncbi:MAG: hypothetical protein M3P98_02740 [bacterium]|nr:hypothetical protein [bacterium]